MEKPVLNVAAWRILGVVFAVR